MTDAEELLAKGLLELSIPNAEMAAARLVNFGIALLEASSHTNLTGAKDLGCLVREHVLDSLAPLKLIRLRSPVVDVGSGAGFPGIPAAITHPAVEFVLLEPRAKRAAFLEAEVRRLSLANVAVIKSSALGPGAAGLAGRAGTVLVRAVAEPEKALAFGLSLLRPGGMLLLYEGRRSAASARESAIARAAGGGAIRVKRLAVPGLLAVRHAWIVEKKYEPGSKS